MHLSTRSFAKLGQSSRSATGWLSPASWQTAREMIACLGVGTLTIAHPKNLVSAWTTPNSIGTQSTRFLKAVVQFEVGAQGIPWVLRGSTDLAHTNPPCPCWSPAPCPPEAQGTHSSHRSATQWSVPKRVYSIQTKPKQTWHGDVEITLLDWPFLWQFIMLQLKHDTLSITMVDVALASFHKKDYDIPNLFC